jgi:tetratricopeptide (TPR) repeat protein
MKMMKTGTLIPLLCLALTILSACAGKEVRNEEQVADQAAMYDEIKVMEKDLFNETMTIDEKKAMQMIGKYNDYAELFPDDTNSARFLYLAADIAGGINKPKIKIQNYSKILERYPEFKGREHVTYLLAFTYDYDMNNREEAKKYYNQVLETAKDSNFVRDAKVRLSTIDRMTYQQYLDSIFANPPVPVQ